MADTGIRGLLYGVSAVNVIIYCRLSSLGGGWQVEKEGVYRMKSSFFTTDCDRIPTLGENIEVNLVFLTRFISPSKPHEHL